MRRNALAALAALTLAMSAPALAGEKTGTEMLFDAGTLDGIEVGTALTYTLNRSADENIPVRTVEDGQIIVSLVQGEAKPRTEATIVEGERRRKLEHFPADRGNPIFVIFLESSVTSVKFATKGSPFYIRNRIKDAFATGGEVSETEVDFGGAQVAATTIAYHPFKADKNRDKLGAAFENLSITFTISADIPGHFVAMTTKAEVDGKEYFIEDVRFETTAKSED